MRSALLWQPPSYRSSRLRVKRKPRKKKITNDMTLSLLKEELPVQKREIFTHPSLGKLPARMVLECVFALSPEGKILHHHREELNATDEGNNMVVYTLNGQSPAPGRERCRIIPPFVREFGAGET
jgi:hypothetical protein